MTISTVVVPRGCRVESSRPREHYHDGCRRRGSSKVSVSSQGAGVRDRGMVDQLPLGKPQRKSERSARLDCLRSCPLCLGLWSAALEP